MKQKFQGRDDDHTYILQQNLKVLQAINRPVRPENILNIKIAYNLNNDETFQLAKATEDIGWTV
jgi:hypothetical protein